jgi:hypothetical protein
VAGLKCSGHERISESSLIDLETEFLFPSMEAIDVELAREMIMDLESSPAS